MGNKNASNMYCTDNNAKQIKGKCNDETAMQRPIAPVVQLVVVVVVVSHIQRIGCQLEKNN